MPILVTGAAGFIGSHLVDHLLKSGHRVIGLDCFDDFYDADVKWSNLSEALTNSAFNLAVGDIRDPSVFDRLPEGIDAIVHLAARAGVRPSIEHPILYYDVNVMGTVRLLEWAGRRGIKRVVFASSSSVYGNNKKVPFAETDSVDQPISPYAATKKAGELLCHAASHLNHMSIACLRFFTVYGPRQRPDLAIHKFARAMLDGRAIPMYGDGSTSRDYTYIQDIISGVVAALQWTHRFQGAYEIFNLGNDRTVSLSDMIRILSEELGVTPRITRLEMQPGDVLRTHADITRAREALNYCPQTDFRNGVRLFAAWLRDVREPVATY
jgi:UDP-glucuronate 4-epimerase